MNSSQDEVGRCKKVPISEEILDLLADRGMLGARAFETPMVREADSR
jgi:hypothetical protein